MATRITPTTGTDRQRILTASAGLFLPTEIHTTKDQDRVFMGGTYLISGGVWQGNVANQTAMLALNTSSTRGCFPMDFCYRSDTASVWACIANRGTMLAEWKEFTSGSGGSTDIRDIWLFI